MKQVTLLVVLAISACGCVAAIRANRENEHLSRWIGRDVGRAVSAWGPPTKEFSRHGTTVYEWDWTGATHAEARRTLGSTEVVSTQDVCREWFDIDETNQIVRFHWVGSC